MTQSEQREDPGAFFVELATAVPDAVLVDRSAAGMGKLVAGEEVVVASSGGAEGVELGGHRVIIRPGPVLDDDLMVHPSGVRVSSLARALVDNLDPNGAGRVLDRAAYEDFVADLATRYGPERLARVVERAKEVAAELGVPERIEDLESIAALALGRPLPGEMGNLLPQGPLLRALVAGRPWDRDRLAAFTQIAAQLAAGEAAADCPVPIRQQAQRSRVLLAFFESYFSNYIEGAIFSVSQALRIIFEGVVPALQAEDAHDVRGTYELAIDEEDCALVAGSPSEFVAILRHRHAVMMAGRPAVHPGELKRELNQAGGYRFVAPELVRGTLEQAYPIICDLEAAFDRAVMTMFVVSEVHPFTDGNGRVGRLSMNAELSDARQCRIVLPTILRNDYLAALRRCSREQDPELLVRVLDASQRWSAAIDWRNLDVVRSTLAATNALVDSSVAEHERLHLIIPEQPPVTADGLDHSWRLAVETTTTR